MPEKIQDGEIEAYLAVLKRKNDILLGNLSFLEDQRSWLFERVPSHNHQNFGVRSNSSILYRSFILLETVA